MKEIGVIHGRFQGLHNDHLRYLLAGKERCRHLVVGITNPDPLMTLADSSDPCRSAEQANPFTYFERLQMVRAALQGAGVGLAEFTIVPLPINFPERYHYYVPMEAVFFLTIYDAWGEKKLKLFQELNLEVDVLWRCLPAEKGLNATELRRRIVNKQPWEDMVPAAVVAVLKACDLAGRLS